MGHRNREIESKYHSEESIEALRSLLEGVLGSRMADVIASSGKDTYWALGDSKFIRIREREQGCQVTVKSKDRGSNLNRIEIDVNCAEPVAHVTKLLEAVHGEQTGVLDKKYWVYWLRGADEHTNVSLYTVKGHAGTFIEFEASTKAKLTEIEGKYLEGLGVVTPESRSLYEIFILPLKDRPTI